MIAQITLIAMIAVAALFVIAILAIIFQFLRLNRYSEDMVLERWSQGLANQGNLKSEFLNMVEAKFKSKALKFRASKPENLDTPQNHYQYPIIFLRKRSVVLAAAIGIHEP